MIKRVNLLAFMWFFCYLCNVEKGEKVLFSLTALHALCG